MIDTELASALANLIPDFLKLDPQEPFKTGAKLVAMAGTLVTILTTLFTKTFPWARAKLESRAVSKRLGPEFPVSNVERTLRYYIPPMCQDLDPAGSEEPRLVYGVQQKLFDALDRLLGHPTEYHFVILLADSGMGKTSALINYYVRHLRRWRKPFKLALVPLGVPDADERIAAIQNRRETVLFLDALDEDTLAIVDHAERLRLLLKATHDFQRVLISCRTQFFSKDEEIPKETGKIKVGARAAGEPAAHYFHKLYLSPFSDEQVSAYLRRRYPVWNLKRRLRAKRMVAKIPHLTARPMLLAHVDDLVRSERAITYSFQLYEEMVEAWLRREEGFVQNKDDLRQFSERLAVNVYLNRAERGSERVQKSELAVLAREWSIPVDDWKLSGRSLLNRDAEGNFKFAHRSIMEYLFVNSFAKRDASCLNAVWTDQMLDFYWEMLELDSSRTPSYLSAIPYEDSDEFWSDGMRSLLGGLLSLGFTKVRMAGQHKLTNHLRTLFTLLNFIAGGRYTNTLQLGLFGEPTDDLLSYDELHTDYYHFERCITNRGLSVYLPKHHLRDWSGRNIRHMHDGLPVVTIPLKSGGLYYGFLDVIHPHGFKERHIGLLCSLLGANEEAAPAGFSPYHLSPSAEWTLTYAARRAEAGKEQVLLVGLLALLARWEEKFLTALEDIPWAPPSIDSVDMARDISRHRNFSHYNVDAGATVPLDTLLHRANLIRRQHGHPLLDTPHLLSAILGLEWPGVFPPGLTVASHILNGVLANMSYETSLDGDYKRMIGDSDGAEPGGEE